MKGRWAREESEEKEVRKNEGKKTSEKKNPTLNYSDKFLVSACLQYYQGHANSSWARLCTCE